MNVTDQLASVITALFLVLALIVGLGFIAARLFQGRRFRGGGAVQVLSCTPVGSREKLIVVAAGSRRLLLGVTAQSITTLERLPDEAPEPEEEPAPRFSLGRALGMPVAGDR